MIPVLQFSPGNGLFHRLNPLTKLVFLVAIITSAVICTSVWFLLLLLVIIVLLAWKSRLHKPLIAQVPLLLIMSIGMIFLTIITIPEGTPLCSLIPAGVPIIGGAIPVTVEALLLGVLLSLRFTLIILSSQLFILSTQPRAIIHLLYRARIPVDYILMFLIAIRFIPMLQIEATRIQEAQLSRGYDPGSGIRGAVRRITPIIIPLVSNSLAKTQTIGLAIDIRGYRRAHPSSFLTFPFTSTDTFACVLCICPVLAGIAILLMH
jgi:energy-coupling factor transport system permease protein